jgi:zinc D-Ala-D-Ala carboxypeptidase
MCYDIINFMNKNPLKDMTHKQKQIGLGVLILVVVGAIGYFVYSTSSGIGKLSADFASTTTEFNQRISNLESDLITIARTNTDLAQKISDQQNNSEIVRQTIGSISSTVNTLEKLSKTDQELLQKYSKVYFVSENYIPIQLSNIDPRYTFDPTKTLQFHTYVLPFLTRMLDDANGVTNAGLQIVSAYRSFGTQSALKSGYKVTYGSGANSFSADQGYSEHQLGTAIDLTQVGSNNSLTISFDQTSAFNWLVNNAYRYGFIPSYPKNNTYYQYEPWHWRFVGVALATFLHNNNKNFYDLDQRTIDTYLATIFD